MTQTTMHKNRRILVIDDNPAIHDEIRRILCNDLGEGDSNGGETAPSGEEHQRTDAGGFQIDAAFQGEAGLELARKAMEQGRPYALVFVDIRMPPGWDGTETLKRIWQVCPDIEAVICSEHSDYSWDEIAAKLGRTDRLLILKKPFDTLAVRQLAQSLTERWNLAHAMRLRLGTSEEGEPSRCDIPIVVVDDDPAVLRILTKLIRDAGYEVRQHADGAEAWEAFDSQEPAVVLTDWRMPGLDGIELCRRIRASDHVGSVYVILLTAADRPEDLVAAFEAGADDFLSKPCNKRELLARVRAGERVLRLLRQQRESAKVIETHNRALEAANRRAAEAIERLTRVQQQLLQADKMASIGQLAAGVAHEINNPIGFISSNLNSLGQYAEDLKAVLDAYDALLHECESHAVLAEKTKEVSQVREEKDIAYVLSDLGNLIDESVEGAQRVRQIVADLRDFSHVDNPEMAEEDINELMDKTLNVAWNELKYKTEVVRELGEIPAIQCYGGKLGQVFLNLLVNAAQAIKERGTITVRTGRQDEHIWVEVADSGCGIPPENLDRVFEPFFTTKDVGKGTGLGLHLAHTIIHAHGGQISVKSTVGEGTTFRIELPIIAPAQAKEKQSECVAP